MRHCKYFGISSSDDDDDNGSATKLEKKKEKEKERKRYWRSNMRVWVVVGLVFCCKESKLTATPTPTLIPCGHTPLEPSSGPIFWFRFYIIFPLLWNLVSVYCLTPNSFLHHPPLSKLSLVSLQTLNHLPKSFLY